MTHAHFSKYPISDLSHPQSGRCRRTMAPAPATPAPPRPRPRPARALAPVIYTIALLLRERVLWCYLTRILEAVMGFNNAFSYRDGPPLL